MPKGTRYTDDFKKQIVFGLASCQTIDDISKNW